MKKDKGTYEGFWENLDRCIKCRGMDALFEESREIMNRTEWVYDKARRLLGSPDEDELVLYVGACEEFCRTYAFAAYEMGREVGPRKPNETFRDWVNDPALWERILQCYDENGNLKTEAAPKKHTAIE